MTAEDFPAAPSLPFPIFQISQNIERYMLYDISTVTWLRRTHNILGVLIGSLPQTPQQNVFLGLPLELQREEARLLVDRGLAFVEVDLDRHVREVAAKSAVQIEEIRADMSAQGMQVARGHRQHKHNRTEKALENIRKRGGITDKKVSNANPTPETEDSSFGETLFEESLIRETTITPSLATPQTDDSDLIPWSITPTISYPPLTRPSEASPLILPKVDPSSYALFAHLHQEGYFMSPGIRFGCQFSVYPGDPLRFHSHFLSMSYAWDEEIDLLDLVGGGRLGTGVKKGWLIGGPENGGGPKKDSGAQGKVRTFCIEWGGM